MDGSTNSEKGSINLSADGQTAREGELVHSGQSVFVFFLILALVLA